MTLELFDALADKIDEGKRIPLEFILAKINEINPRWEGEQTVFEKSYQTALSEDFKIKIIHTVLHSSHPRTCSSYDLSVYFKQPIKTPGSKEWNLVFNYCEMYDKLGKVAELYKRINRNYRKNVKVTSTVDDLFATPVASQ